MEEQLKATYEQIKQIELELSTLEESEAVMQTRALQISKATADRLEIDNIVAGMPALFDFVKQVLPKP
jgi:RNA-binding protein YlmH